MDISFRPEFIEEGTGRFFKLKGIDGIGQKILSTDPLSAVIDHGLGKIPKSLIIISQTGGEGVISFDFATIADADQDTYANYTRTVASEMLVFFS